MKHNMYTYRNIIIGFALIISFMTPGLVVKSKENQMIIIDKILYPSEKIAEGNIDLLKFELGEKNPHKRQLLTYTLDDDGNIINIKNPIEIKGSEIKKVAVKVKQVIVGYIITSVVNGIVISATGQSGEWWVYQAIVQVLNKQFRSSTTINCSIYPPNSYAGAKCRSY